MTEADYVLTIRDAAQRYVDVIRDPERVDAGQAHLLHWMAIKEKLSPFTAIALCDAWLQMVEKDDAV